MSSSFTGSFVNSFAKSSFGKTLGSIKLAVPLLIAIAAILIGATFYEAEVGSAVVQQEIYKSPWFGGLMFLLALNLGTSTLSRYPWRGARKVGFAITHWGLVVIIAGSAAVIHLSVEGMLLARTDAGPVGTLRVEGDLLEVVAPGEAPQQASLFIKADGTVVPSKVGALSILGYSNNAINTVHFEPGGRVENPAVRLVLKSDRMGQTLERWLAVAPAAYSALDIGPAELQIARVADEEALTQALSEPVAEAQSAAWGTISLDWKGKFREIDVEAALTQSANQPIVLKDEGGTLKAEVTGFWPDFRLDGNRQPTTATQLLRNPAVRLVVTESSSGKGETAEGDRQESWFLFGKPGFEPVRNGEADAPISLGLSYEAAPTASGPDAFFRIVIDAAGQLHYAAKSSKGFLSGPMAVGDTVSPGWADFKVTLAEYIPRAKVAREVVPLPKDAPPQGEPALLVSTGEETSPVWVAWGEPTAISGKTGSRSDDWYVAFSPKLMQLPFSLKLNEFIVERNEGSESVAMWTSDISLMDAEAGQISDRRVWMNHPTWFKGWKIAQASWNPGDLNQSTLQVKREPWWVTGLTWLGSTMVTAGVATMFYGRAVAKKFKKVSTLLDVPEDSPEAGNDTSPGSIPLFNAFLGR
ncbi:MAG: cytochrome c biogenesis protein ResB [Cyanobacteria bacterium J06623_4]